MIKSYIIFYKISRIVFFTPVFVLCAIVIYLTSGLLASAVASPAPLWGNGTHSHGHRDLKGAGVTAEGALATLVFDVKETKLHSVQPLVQPLELQLADSRTREIPVAVVNERVSMRELFPDKPMLMQNYPNPFNPETWIPYQLSTDSEVVISIYNSNGERVRQLDLGYQPVGTYRDRAKAAYWDGRNEFGETVASGVYFYHLSAVDYSATRKLVILK